MKDLRAHPHYFTGFYDALDFVPLFDDASDAYKAGWRAAWETKRIFDTMKKAEAA